MTDIVYLYQPELNRLFIAINHYVSTGDRIGEGVATVEEDRLQILLPVKARDPRDAEDFRRFCARFDELAPRFGLSLEFKANAIGMDVWGFLIDPDQIDALSSALRERAGPLGWGSIYRELAECGLTAE